YYYLRRRDLHSFPTRRSSDLRDCRRTSDFLSWSTRMTPIRCTSCHLRGRRAPVQAARQRCVAAKMAASHGAGSHVGCLGSKATRSEEHTSELQSRENLVCRPL